MTLPVVSDPWVNPRRPVLPHGPGIGFSSSGGFQGGGGGAPSGAPFDSFPSQLSFPTGLGYTVQGESLPRTLAKTALTFTSGTSRICSIPLRAGTVISKVTFITGTTAEVTGAHNWVALLDVNLKVIAVSADNTGTPFTPAGQAVTFTIAPTITLTSPGQFYLELLINATTEPSIIDADFGAQAGANAIAPVMSGQGASLLTTPPAVGTTRTITATTNTQLYACVGN